MSSDLSVLSLRLVDNVNDMMQVHSLLLESTIMGVPQIRF